MDVDALAQKQFRALQEKNVELTQRCEVYARLLGCFSNTLKGSDEFITVEDHVAIPVTETDALPHICNVNIGQVVAKDAEDAESEDVVLWVIRVEPKGDTNGSLEVPVRPRLVLP